AVGTRVRCWSVLLAYRTCLDVLVKPRIADLAPLGGCRLSDPLRCAFGLDFSSSGSESDGYRGDEAAAYLGADRAFPLGAAPFLCVRLRGLFGHQSVDGELVSLRCRTTGLPLALQAHWHRGGQIGRAVRQRVPTLHGADGPIHPPIVGLSR